jgi:oligopeptide transport system ATP-binding protein
MAVILITHDLGVIAEFTDRLVVMYGGLIMEQGDVAPLFAAPGHPYMQGLLASVPDLRDDLQTRLTPIAGSPPDMLRPPSGCPFAPRCPQAMLVCAKLPPLFDTGPQRRTRCWLHHPDAPKMAPNGGQT